jgi:drug/metabolite transporter (DMT)-like permease
MDLNFLLTIATVCWAAWGIFDKKAFEAGGSFWKIFLTAYAFPVVSVPIIVVALLLTHGWHISVQLVLWTGISAVCYVGGILLYLYAMSRSEASWTLGLTAAYPIITNVLSMLLGDKSSDLRLLGTVVAMAGIFFIGSSWQRDPHLNRRGALLVAGAVFGTMVLWGAVAVFDAHAVRISSPLLTSAVMGAWQVLLWLVLYWVRCRRGEKLELSKPQPFKRFAFGSGLCLTFGNLAYVFALAHAACGLVVALTGTYPVLMYLMSVAFLKERVNPVRAAGIAVVAVGVVLVEMSA